LYFQSDLGRRAASCWALPHISSYFWPRPRSRPQSPDLGLGLEVLASFNISINLRQLKPLGDEPSLSYLTLIMFINFNRKSQYLLYSVSNRRCLICVAFCLQQCRQDVYSQNCRQHSHISTMDTNALRQHGNVRFYRQNNSLLHTKSMLPRPGDF